MAALLEGQRGYALDYLFTAAFADGSELLQNETDCSRSEAGRSAFYDVAARLDEVILFQLSGREHRFLVDLRDGHFEIDGVPFFAQPCDSNSIPEGGKFQLIYFRDHQQDLQLSSDAAEFGDHRIAYRIGWTYTVNQQTWTQTIVVS